MRSIAFALTLAFVTAIFAPGSMCEASTAEKPMPAWTTADRQQPPTAAETRAFMKGLLQYIEEHHLKKDEKSEQRGMVYEYFDTRRAGRFDQWVQGEALDTMHDGAWLAAALVNAYRATGDPAYKDFLVRWQLPFYCKMLNHSDRLFSAGRDDARSRALASIASIGCKKAKKGSCPTGGTTAPRSVWNGGATRIRWGRSPVWIGSPVSRIRNTFSTAIRTVLPITWPKLSASCWSWPGRYCATRKIRRNEKWPRKQPRPPNTCTNAECGITTTSQCATLPPLWPTLTRR